jgi:hypothetical protein
MTFTERLRLRRTRLASTSSVKVSHCFRPAIPTDECRWTVCATLCIFSNAIWASIVTAVPAAGDFRSVPATGGRSRHRAGKLLGDQQLLSVCWFYPLYTAR